LLDRAATEPDPQTRAQLYDKVAKRVVDANSYIYLYNPEVVQGWSPDVTGYQIRADRAVNFETVKFR
jgi:peptide/nickel transport system substrate-binding protein